MSNQLTPILLNIETPVAKALKKEAKENGETRTALIRRILDKHIKGE